MVIIVVCVTEVCTRTKLYVSIFTFKIESAVCIKKVWVHCKEKSIDSLDQGTYSPVVYEAEETTPFHEVS